VITKNAAAVWSLRYYLVKSFTEQRKMHSVINWQQDWRKISGVPVKSPVTQHPEPLYQQDLLPAAVCVRLEHGLILTPFTCQLHTTLAAERRLHFQHQSGMKLCLELSPKLAKLNGRGLHWLAAKTQTLSAGTPVLQLDLAFLQLELDLEELYCLLYLDSPVRIDKLYCRQSQLVAGQDPLFIMQLKKPLS
jgi:phosphotransferase system IIA component